MYLQNKAQAWFALQTIAEFDPFRALLSIIGLLLVQNNTPQKQSWLS